MRPNTQSGITAGLLVLHGNRAEVLAEAVFEWLRRNPLSPLEEEIFLVQSNGVAEWLKMSLATYSGVCAATRVELPARFLWRAYRQLLGREAVPSQSALDKLPLTWRLMQLLPELTDRPGFEPVAGFLRGGDAARRLQLAQRLADLYDQYQVYRGDWLEAWGQGRDVLPGPPGQAAQELPQDQGWQAALWRELLAGLDPQERDGIRPRLHQRFIAALESGARPLAPLPRRVVLFGMTHVPMQTLQALSALSTSCQVLLAVPNPCRYHWADIIDGRELLQVARRRHPWRAGRDLAAVGLDEMHAHAHPLLAAWGRQGRDFVRQLDAFDDALAAQQRFALSRVDLFDDGPGDTLLEQVQARIRDLVPLSEHAAAAESPGVDPADRSIVFHVAHGAQREVEILHDQLLGLLAHPPGGRPLQPRDVVVMVPDIETFAPAIRSVFGQVPRGDARFIPHDIADLRDRGHSPLLVAVEWLLGLPGRRCGLAEVRDLLDVAAVTRRFGLTDDDLPRLAQWLQGAGVRWGLHADHRAALDLAACGEQNTWLFGLRRMLMGYAVGEGTAESDAFQGIEPYAEVGGLEAALAGSLADLVQALSSWFEQSREAAAPVVWAERCRVLLAAFFDPVDEAERAAVSALNDALGAWLQACAAARFEQAVDLSVVREAWLAGVDDPGLGRRFRAGGVTFCTLLPMRAVPFEVVCLLGMNDGDYPRRGIRSDLDLMGLPGQQRPGDRSRRDDDRQLMLEALLSARRVLHVSWSGRSARDNSPQPPSVLVAQLRDYLAAGWGPAVLAARTREHPLQPFSRRYFEARAETFAGGDGPPLFSYAREWRAVHAATATGTADAGVVGPPLAVEAGTDVPVTVAALASFLKNPVKEYFRRRLGVVFGDDEDTGDDEPFTVTGLGEYTLVRDLLSELHRALEAAPMRDVGELVSSRVARVQRAGRLPLAAPGRRTAQALVDGLTPMLTRWQALQAMYPQRMTELRLRCTQDGLVLDDWIGGVRSAALGTEGGRMAWLELVPSRLCADPRKGTVRADRLLEAWVRMLAAGAGGVSLPGIIVGRDACITVQPWAQGPASTALAVLMQAWHEGLYGSAAPWPLAARTALAWVQGGRDAAAVYDGNDFARGPPGEGAEACLARLFPDHASLRADGRFDLLSERLFGPVAQWILNDVRVDVHVAGGPGPGGGGEDG